MVSVAGLLVVALQQATLSGVVRDSVDLEPVAFARVAVSFANRDGAVATAESDRFGAFVAPGSPAGAAVRIEVEAYGYQSLSRDYDELPRAEMLVLLRSAPVALDSLLVNTRGQPGNPMGQNYANFIEVAGRYPVRHPWPSFGLEGGYGYFAGAAPSKPVRVLIAPLDPSLPAAAPGSS